MHRTTAMCCRNALACFYAFLFFDPSDDFAKSMAFAWWPFLAIFKMLLFFQYKLFLGAVFWIEQQQSFAEMFLACFHAFLFFDPKWRFCKVYSLCLVAIFGYFQNAPIFRILAVFWGRLLHRTTAMCCRNVLSMFLCIFIFWPKVTILQSL